MTHIENDTGIVTKEEAKKMLLIKDGMVHTFYNFARGLIGADHNLKSITEDIDKSYECRLTGKHAQAMGHGLAVIPTKKCQQSDVLFVETKKKVDEK